MARVYAFLINGFSVYCFFGVFFGASFCCFCYRRHPFRTSYSRIFVFEKRLGKKRFRCECYCCLAPANACLNQAPTCLARGRKLMIRCDISSHSSSAVFISPLSLIALVGVVLTLPGLHKPPRDDASIPAKLCLNIRQPIRIRKPISGFQKAIHHI